MTRELFDKISKRTSHLPLLILEQITFMSFLLKLFKLPLDTPPRLLNNLVLLNSTIHTLIHLALVKVLEGLIKDRLLFIRLSNLVQCSIKQTQHTLNRVFEILILHLVALVIILQLLNQQMDSASYTQLILLKQLPITFVDLNVLFLLKVFLHFLTLSLEVSLLFKSFKLVPKL